MLVLTRYPEERIRIGSDIKVTVLSVRGNKVRIGIEAPKDLPVHREEIFQRIVSDSETGNENPAEHR